jgi:hypothetical protein
MKKNLQIGIVGDIIPADSPLMSGQGIYSVCQGNFEPLFSDFQNYAKKFNFMVGNFEAVLVKKIDKVSPGTSAMKAPLSILPVLKKCGFKYMSIANNHTMEYGPNAFHYMCDKLNEFGIQTFGHKDIPFHIIEDYDLDVKIGIFAFSTVPAMYGFDPEYYYVNPYSLMEINALLQQIKIAKSECNHLIIFPHWGSEYMSYPAPWQIKLANQLINLGVDAIVGAHPHIIQKSCFINKKPVLFSIENLLSDYIHESFKKNAVITIKMDKNNIDISGHIFSTDHNFRIYNTGIELNLHSLDLTQTNYLDEEYAFQANKTRTKVRNELILHLLRYPHRWIFNVGMWSWLFKRTFFLVSNIKKIKKNPNAVYSGPIH